MREYKLEIVTPDGAIYNGNVESLLLRCNTGDMEILAGHTDLFASVGIGRARIKTADATVLGSVSGGFLSVKGGAVTLVATTFVFKENIDLERARAAKERAEAKLLDAKDDREITIAKAKLARAINRINVASMK